MSLLRLIGAFSGSALRCCRRGVIGLRALVRTRPSLVILVVTSASVPVLGSVLVHLLWTRAEGLRSRAVVTTTVVHWLLRLAPMIKSWFFKRINH